MNKIKIVFSVIFFLSITAIFTLDLLTAEDLTPVLKFGDGGASNQNSPQDFPTVYQGEVTFTHKKYIQLYKGDCGKCHKKVTDTGANGS